MSAGPTNGTSRLLLRRPPSESSDRLAVLPTSSASPAPASAVTAPAAAAAQALWAIPDSLSTLLFSSTAAFITRCITHPLDTLKTRIQNSTSPLTIATALRATPPRTLYRGVGVSLLFSVPALSVYLTSYDYFKHLLGTRSNSGEGSIAVHAASAGIAECLSGLFWTPMEVIKSRLQCEVAAARGSSSSSSSASVNPSRELRTMAMVRRISAESGLRGFFRGYWISLAVFVPYTVVYFVTYEQLKSGLSSAWARAAGPAEASWRGSRPPPLLNATPASERINAQQQVSQQQAGVTPFPIYLLSSGAAGALAGGLSNVLDVVKTRVQVTGGRVWVVARRMYIEEGGLRAFTRGMTARVLWLAPSVTISMTAFEVLKDWRARVKG